VRLRDPAGRAGNADVRDAEADEKYRGCGPPPVLDAPAIEAQRARDDPGHRPPRRRRRAFASRLEGKKGRRTTMIGNSTTFPDAATGLFRDGHGLAICPAAGASGRLAGANPVRLIRAPFVAGRRVPTFVGRTYARGTRQGARPSRSWSTTRGGAGGPSWAPRKARAPAPPADGYTLLLDLAGHDRVQQSGPLQGAGLRSRSRTSRRSPRPPATLAQRAGGPLPANSGRDRRRSCGGRRAPKTGPSLNVRLRAASAASLPHVGP